MSSDQKPARIKVVSSGLAAPGTAADAAAVGEQETKPVEAPEKGGLGLFPILLFLIGCAAGGAGLVAWPHFMG